MADQATIDAVNEELNFPSLQKLRGVLDKRKIPYNVKNLERLLKRETVRQVQAPAYKYDGKIASKELNDRWFADLIDFTAAPSDGGRRTGLKTTKDGESYILVVQDVFSRFLWTEALVNKTPKEVAEAFEKILRRADAVPRSVTSDFGPEFDGPFREMLKSKGIAGVQKRPSDKNAIATLDVAIGSFKKALVRFLRKINSNDWAAHLRKVTDGQNEIPNDSYLDGRAPADVRKDNALMDELEAKNAQFDAYNRERFEKRGRALEKAGQFRAAISDGNRGFRPRFGQLRQVADVRRTEVIDQDGRIFSSKFALPVESATADAGPIRIEQGGSELVDRTRRERLSPFAEKLAKFLQTKGRKTTTAVASKYLRRDPAFRVAMRNLPSFSKFIRLFDMFELITSDTTGGASSVKLR